MPEPEQRTPNGLRLTGPGGWGLTASGRDVVMLLTIIIGFAALVYFNHGDLQAIKSGLDRQETAANEQRTGRDRAVTSLHEDHVQLMELMREITLYTYLSLPADQRARLIPPSELRDRLHGGGR